MVSLKNFIIILKNLDDRVYISISDLSYKSKIRYNTVKRIIAIMLEMKILSSEIPRDKRFANTVRLNLRGLDVKNNISGVDVHDRKRI
jgi:hypothetical protein